MTSKTESTPLPETARFATVRNDITLPYYTDVLDFVDEVLIQQGGGKGLALYDEIERDAHAYAVLQKRKHQLVGREWIVTDGGASKADKAAGDFWREQLNALPFDQICLDFLDATLKGFSVGEAEYARDGRHVTVDAIHSLDQRRFVFDLDMRPRLLTMSAPAKGEELPERKFIAHRFGMKGNNPYGLGLGSRLFWPVLFKRKGVGFWMTFLDRFASPIPVGKYPLGTLPAQQRDLMNVLRGMNHASAITVPLGTELESFEGKRSGTVDYEKWGAFWNAEISKATNGETLTTEMGSNGARAASETHHDILDALVDSDADLLSGTLNTTIVRWVTEWNYPGATPPTIWRPRPSNELEIEELERKRAERRSKQLGVLREAQQMGYEPENVEGYLEDVFAGPVRVIEPQSTQKKTPELAFSEGVIAPGDMLSEVLKLLRPTHEAWIEDLRGLAEKAADANELSEAMLRWWAELGTPDYAEALGDAFALAWLNGRGEVMDEIDGPALSEPVSGTVRFNEAHNFLRQKVSLPSRAWTDHLHQAHDRAFVVAGADSVSLVEDIRGALTRAMDGGGGLEAFRRDFDEIVARTGWEYNGGRNWRTRVIYETNLRNAHMAGRLAQMRDPSVVARRPFWQYVHGETRTPKTPRDEHLAWDGKVWRHDDPIWSTIFPPNDWQCSCGVRALSAAGMRRLGKTGPDPTPELEMRMVSIPSTGETVPVPKGIGLGWGYQPGDTWTRGLVPRELQRPLDALQPDLPLPVSPPLSEIGRPFASSPLPDGQNAEYYARRFLQRFGADIGQPRAFRDRSGQLLPISDDLVRNGSGRLKANKHGRGPMMEMLAEAIFDPDEIWVDWQADTEGGSPRLVRRYLRWDPNLSAFSVFEWRGLGWTGKTTMPASRGRRNLPDMNYLEVRRRGALLYRRER